MSAWTVVPCLLSLRDEFNRINPNRDKGADGTIGDTAHTSASDHTPDEDSNILRDHDADHKNEVHALDIDSTGPWPGTTFQARVDRVIAGERAKWLDPADVCRLEYVIYNRKIYSRSRDFAARDHTGSDPHTNHAHFSARYISGAEADTRSFGVYVAPPAPKPPVEDIVEQSDIDKIVAAVVAKLPAAVLTEPTKSKVYGGRDLYSLAGDLHAFLDDWAGDSKGAAVRPVAEGSYGDITRGVPAAVAELSGKLDEVLKLLKAQSA